MPASPARKAAAAPAASPARAARAASPVKAAAKPAAQPAKAAAESPKRRGRAAEVGQGVHARREWCRRAAVHRPLPSHRNRSAGVLPGRNRSRRRMARRLRRPRSAAARASIPWCARRPLLALQADARRPLCQPEPEPEEEAEEEEDEEEVAEPPAKAAKGKAGASAAAAAAKPKAKAKPIVVDDDEDNPEEAEDEAGAGAEGKKSSLAVTDKLRKHKQALRYPCAASPRPPRAYRLRSKHGTDPLEEAEALAAAAVNRLDRPHKAAKEHKFSESGSDTASDKDKGGKGANAKGAKGAKPAAAAAAAAEEDDDEQEDEEADEDEDDEEAAPKRLGATRQPRAADRGAHARGSAPLSAGLARGYQEAPGARQEAPRVARPPGGQGQAATPVDGRGGGQPSRRRGAAGQRQLEQDPRGVRLQRQVRRGPQGQGAPLPAQARGEQSVTAAVAL